jgi:hypothetical protein
MIAASLVIADPRGRVSARLVEQVLDLTDRLHRFPAVFTASRPISRSRRRAGGELLVLPVAKRDLGLLGLGS